MIARRRDAYRHRQMVSHRRGETGRGTMGIHDRDWWAVGSEDLQHERALAARRVRDESDAR